MKDELAGTCRRNDLLGEIPKSNTTAVGHRNQLAELGKRAAQSIQSPDSRRFSLARMLQCRSESPVASLLLRCFCPRRRGHTQGHREHQAAGREPGHRSTRECRQSARGPCPMTLHAGQAGLSRMSRRIALKKLLHHAARWRISRGRNARLIGLRSFRPIASTGAAGFASHLMRLGESGTPSLVCCPEPGEPSEPGTVRPWMISTPGSSPS